MKIVLIFLSLLVSNFLFAQQNAVIKQVSTKASVAAPVEKKNEKKVHYVEKRTKPVQNNSKTVAGSQTQKKPVIRRAENQKKTVLK